MHATWHADVDDDYEKLHFAEFCRTKRFGTMDNVDSFSDSLSNYEQRQSRLTTSSF
jgi:hypothetical protein